MFNIDAFLIGHDVLRDYLTNFILIIIMTIIMIYDVIIFMIVIMTTLFHGNLLFCFPYYLSLSILWFLVFVSSNL